MSSQTLDICVALSAQELDKQACQKVRLINGYHLEWQNDNNFTLICEDEDVSHTVDLHQDKVSSVLALKHESNHGNFLTIGLDNKIHVFKFYGENIATMEEHEDTILGAIELKNGDIVTVSKDESLRFWNPRTGVVKAIIDAKVEQLSNINFFSNRKQLTINEPTGVSIWRFSGEKIIELKGQTKPISVAYSLQNGYWLIWSDGEFPSLWSDQGDMLKRFSFNFSPDNGFVEKVDVEQLLIQSEHGQVSLWQYDGTLIDAHVRCSDVTEIFNDLSKAQRSVNDHIDEHPSINHYPHLRNFFGSKQYKSLLVPAIEMEKQGLNFDGDEKRQELWNFFNRPIPRLLATAMKHEVKVARTAEKSLNEKITTAEEAMSTHQKKRSFNKGVSFFWLLLTAVIAAAGGYFGTESNAPDAFNNLAHSYIPDYRSLPLEVVWGIFGAGATFTFLLCFSFFMKNRAQKKKQLREQGNLTLLNAMLPSFHQIIDQVKAHRSKLWKSVPLKKNRNLYNGESANEIIQDIIKNNIEQNGLDECGLDKEDVIYSNHEAIVLSDWALIQSNEKRQQVRNKLHGDNEFSFWSDKNGSLIFGVQYIQFIFLTAEKIDLFTTFYDFLNQKCIGKEANAFYYKDVTNISKREVDRENGFSQKGIPATEISLSVSSGDQIHLTILNEDSLSSIVEAAKQSEEQERAKDHSILMQLENKKKEILADTSLDEEEREEELDDIETQLSAMKKENTVLDSVVSTNKADEAIKNIRHQIRQHKQERNEEAIS